MAKLGINTGTSPNSGTGDTLLSGAIKINSNFNELYNLLGNGTNLSSGIVTSITAGSGVSINQSTGNVTISATGGGGGSSYWVSNASGIHTTSNVGIGTTNPQTKLEVDGVIGFTTDVYGQNNIRLGDKNTGFNLTTGNSNILIGAGAGSSLTSSYSNVFIGAQSGYGYNPSDGIFIGNYSGYNAGGNVNIFIGSYSGQNYYGVNSIVIGKESGYSDTSFDEGYYSLERNIFLGHYAGEYIRGKQNIFIGNYSAGRTSKSYTLTNSLQQRDNTFVGYFSGYYLTTGSRNSFFGSESGYLLTTGTDNSFFGRESGYHTTTGDLNSFFGRLSGDRNTTGTANAFFGQKAGQYNTIGNFNTFIGTKSGRYNTTGSSNIFLGSYTGLSQTNKHKVIIGSGIGYTGDWNLIADVDYYFDAPDTTKDYQLAIGMRTNPSSSDYWILGDENFNIGIGAQASSTYKLNVGGDINFNGNLYQNGSLFSGGGGGSSYWVSNASGIHTTSNVGIGTTNPQTKLEVNGVVGFTTDSNGDNNILIGDKNTGFNLAPETFTSSILIGIGAGSSLTSGNNNTFIGKKAGHYSTGGAYNNFFGHYVGYYSAGSNNTFIGKYTGYHNTGNRNNFFGFYAGYYNTGSYNILIGEYAGYYNTGNRNNFLGVNAGYYNTSGFNNNFFGESAGYYNTTGTSNNFFGRLAGFKNTTGSANNFFGETAGLENTIGIRNNFIGASAANHNTTGSDNNFIGGSAAYYNTTGNSNIFIGNSTGLSTSASYKVILGTGYNSTYTFDSPNTTKDYQFAVGIRTSTSPSKYWLVGDENFNVGIGTQASSTYKLSVGGDINFTGNLYQNGSLFTGGGSSYWVSNASGIHTTSNVGIGTTNPTSKLHVVGDSKLGGVIETVSTATTYMSGSSLVLELDVRAATTYTYTIPTGANIGIVSFKNMPAQTGNQSGSTITCIFTQNSAGTGNTTAATGIGTNITVVGYENGASVAGISTIAFVGSGTTVTLSSTGLDRDFVSFFVHYNGGTNTSASSYSVYATKNGGFR